MSDEVLLDLGFLTEDERDIINRVIFKDVEVRKQEQSRISLLRRELDQLKEDGIPEDEIESKNERYCARCQTYFGVIWNKGAFCPRCDLKVCKVCRVDVADDGWICTLCSKVREVKAQSGAWFFQGHKEKTGNLFGSMLVRKSLRRLPGSEAGQGGERPRKDKLASYILDNQYQAPANHAAKNHKKSDDRPVERLDQNHYQTRSDNEEQEDLEYSDASDVESDKGSYDEGSNQESQGTRTESERSHSERDVASHPVVRDEEPGEEFSTWKADVKTGDESDLDEEPTLGKEPTVDEEPALDEKPALNEEPDDKTLNIFAKSLQDPRDRSDHETVGYKETRPDEDSSTIKTSTSEESPTVEDPSSLDSRESALRAFSETFASVQANQGSGKSHENRDEQTSSDPRVEAHGAFSADSESIMSETSGYVTPTPSDDTSSKRTPSISGDEGASIPKGFQRVHSQEQTPIIITPEVDNEKVGNEKARQDKKEKTPTSRPSSFIEYEEDLDVSFHKYGSGLGNKMLKDQLSMGSRESIASYYSNAGGEVYGKYPVTGEILFGIKYDAKIQEFQVQVHQARDIAAVDEKRKVSDPYVKTYLLPDRSRTGKRKTKVKKNTINPVFDEILTYKISYDEILQRTLWLAVWNHDRFGHNDFLGEVLVPIDEYHQSGFSLEDPEPQWYDLCERQSEDAALSYNGEIVLALKFVPPSAVVSKKKKKKKKDESEKGELHINIIEANNLIAKDTNGYSDPFCKSYLLPDKSKKTKQKTAVVKKSLNPKWNYHFVYDNLTHEELMDRVLELTVWDYDRGSSNEFLGGVRLGLGAGLQEWDDANSEEQAAWNKMLNNPNDWNEVSLTLRDHMGNHQLSVGDMQECVDPALVEIQPSHKPTELPTQSKTNPDEDLIRHSEYHRPYETKIDAAKKSSDARLSSPPPAATVTGESSARKMTLVELARLRSASTDEKDESKSVRSSSLVSDKVTVEITPTNDETADNDSLVRHSEFYQGSKSPNVTRRRSADSQLSLGEPVAERRPTLVDMLQKNTDTDDDNNNDNRIGNNISVQKDVSASRESIYSMDGDYSNNNISGEILLSYHYLNGDFKIKVFEARGIAATDKNKNTSDPYVKVYLLPDQSRTGKRKTKTKYGTLDPEFNEEILYKIGTRELLTRTIWLTMWNYDRFGRNDFLGEVRIPLKDFKGSKEHPKWHTLCEMIPDSTSDSCGELTVALMYSPTEKKRKKETNAGKLYVKIVEAKNLPGKDSDHLSDPFCKSYLLPDPGKKTKKKTPVMKRNLNPYWDYKFSYDNLSLEELHSCVLELTVWDHDLGTSNDFLGGVRIGLGTSDAEWDDCEGEEVSLWQFLLSKPNTWTQSILPLRNQMGSRKGLKT